MLVLQADGVHACSSSFTNTNCVMPGELIGYGSSFNIETLHPLLGAAAPQHPRSTGGSGFGAGAGAWNMVAATRQAAAVMPSGVRLCVVVVYLCCAVLCLLFVYTDSWVQSFSEFMAHDVESVDQHAVCGPSDD